MYLRVWGRRKRFFDQPLLLGRDSFFLTLEDERLTVFVCYHHAVRKVWTVLDAWKKSRLVLWLLIDVLSVYSCSKKKWASSNRGRSAMVYTRKRSWFSTGWSLFYWLFTLKHFVFLPFKKTWLAYWMTVLGVVQKVLGASSVELLFVEFNMTSK